MFCYKNIIFNVVIIWGVGSVNALAETTLSLAVNTAYDQKPKSVKSKTETRIGKKQTKPEVLVAPSKQAPSELVDHSQIDTKPAQKIQSPVSETAIKPKQLSAINVGSGRAKNLLGIAATASQGEVSQAQFEYRPLARAGELVEVVPGAVATQHSGSGKANQYFLRGYNLDHGTDFSIIVDGIPMNMPTHAHGQGYMDINSIIPELVKNVQYGKGPYYAEVGDFASAGYAKMFSVNHLPEGIIKFTAGQYDYYRTLVANSIKVGSGDLLYAGEFNLYNGVWQVPEDSRKFNGMLRYSLDEDNHGLAINLKGYTNDWTATNQIPQSAVDNGSIGLYGSMSPIDGGKSNRYSLSTNLWHKGQDWKNDADLYALYYDVDLYSNYTGYLNGAQGDQVHQFEHRIQTGGNIEHTRYNTLFGFDMDNTLGLNFRHDEILSLGLDQTINRQYDKTISHDTASETTAGAFFKNETHWLQKFRTVAGLRGDFINNDVVMLENGYTNINNAMAATLNAANSGSSAKIMVSPKLGLIVGPWYDTEYFVNMGYGYHSNDARGTILQLNPAIQRDSLGNLLAPTNLGGDGTPISRVTPMAWSRGGEVGARSHFIPKLNSTLAFWWLESSQELVFKGDDGTTGVNDTSHRYGVEFDNYYKPTDWLTLDADLALTTSRYAKLTFGEINNNVPNSVGRVVSFGATAVAPNGVFGTVRLRHFGDMPLDTSGKYWAGDTSIVNLGAGYKHKNYKLELDIFNLFDSESNDIAYAYQYAYPSPVASSAIVPTGVLKHPVEPRSVRGTITLHF